MDWNQTVADLINERIKVKDAVEGYKFDKSQSETSSHSNSANNLTKFCNICDEKHLSHPNISLCEYLKIKQSSSLYGINSLYLIKEGLVDKYIEYMNDPTEYFNKVYTDLY